MTPRSRSAASAPKIALVAPDSITESRAAVQRGAWAEVRALVNPTLATTESADALEDLGLAAWWLDDATLTFEARERAYALYRDQRDARGAARMAIWLTWDYLAFRGDFAVASGWLERARHLLADDQRNAEYGWLLIREGEVALFRGHEPAVAIDRARAAAALARDIGDQSVEFTALALEGLARVSTGDIEAGMRRLDEAAIAATAGEMKELHAVGVVCCWQIFACERVRDYDRAAQWCARVQEFTRRWGLRPLSAVCRTQYAGVLMWRGDWARAEAELTASARELELVRPGMTASALARLGELRLRQGALDEAQRLFEQSPSSSQSRLGLAALAIERGHPAEGCAVLEQVLGQLGPDEATARAGALELLVRAYAMQDDVHAAARHLEELERIAADLRTDPLTASAAAARGAVLRARGDHAQAANAFETAVDLFERNGAPFETARGRLDLASEYAALLRLESAERETRLALAAFDALGAKRESARAARLLKEYTGASASGAKGKDMRALTARQVEILRLVAQGMTNIEIAERLKLSDHTVKRHVTNLLTKLGLPSRVAAAVYASREGLL